MTDFDDVSDINESSCFVGFWIYSCSLNCCLSIVNSRDYILRALRMMIVLMVGSINHINNIAGC